jgi:hypothetical protein
MTIEVIIDVIVLVAVTVLVATAAKGKCSTQLATNVANHANYLSNLQVTNPFSVATASKNVAKKQVYTTLLTTNVAKE